ncbi:MAG: alpha-ribazole phosphatase [Eubacteriales bacterium]|nr:alpha-ribazole phosphatase [Bacillota bacterium]MBV1726890.1 alpha-ribazole phosphatase [Desulforudis sp.]MDQ7788589.1 alpha-ribazole phosphatase [Clostridia bacterium]MDZ4043102.1 alpha-ribazole phosphatase [Eubacteriales bacterium]MBU4533314.1 alpha-ribazole phosphatase [Bacillota bacterium]
MVCSLYLVRHGETLWNNVMRYQGHCDIALNETGERQARALADRLAGEQFAAVYSSDLTRAYQTASIIAQPHGLPVNRLNSLREIHFGEWEGLSREEIRRRYPKESELWWAQPLYTRLPGGETLAEVRDRAVGSVQSIARNHTGDQVIITAHGGTIRAIVATYLGMDLNEYWRLRQDNAALSIVDVYDDDRGQLRLFNDTTHLP